jgi:hypothetical protein
MVSLDSKEPTARGGVKSVKTEPDLPLSPDPSALNLSDSNLVGIQAEIQGKGKGTSWRQHDLDGPLLLVKPVAIGRAQGFPLLSPLPCSTAPFT